MKAAFNGVSFFPSRFWDAEDRIVLGRIPKPFGLSLHVLGKVSPRCGPWTLMYSGPGSQILWPHNKSTVERAREYSVESVQGKVVTSALNAPTNVLAILMGKDS